MEHNITGVRTPSQWFVAALSAATLVSAIVFSPEAEAACGAQLNGRPMTAQECISLRSIYGSVLPGRYASDGRGNWVNLDNPGHRGNIYTDRRRGGGGGGGGGLTCVDGTCVGPDGMINDRGTGYSR